MLGRAAGVPVPDTMYPESEEELYRLSFDFPVILKPSIVANFISVIKLKAILANNLDELVRYYRFMASVIDRSEIMVQELIRGGTRNLFSFCSFFRDGEVRGKIMARRLRQHPMDFGTSTTYAVTCDIPELEELATKVLRKMNYYGLSEVEFMFDEKDNVYKLIDINTRTWAWHTLGAKAGVNFPLLLYKDMHNEGFSVESFETGIKWVREVTDFTIAMTEVLKRSMTIKDYLRSLKGEKQLAVFSLADPLPFFADLFMAPYKFYQRGFRM
jgi:predicted ATP-grasp superfamily ATP-dependent carboligase